MIQAHTGTPAPDDLAEPEDDTAYSPAALVRQIHAGERDVARLTVAQRQGCVTYLTLEGFTASEIAELLRIGERTVRRDRVAARKAEALAPDNALGDELLGEFQNLALASIQRLIRLCRDDRSPAYARMWAEEAIVRNYQRFIDTAAKLRYLQDGNARLIEQRRSDPDYEDRQVEETRRSTRMMERQNKAMLDEMRRAQDERPGSMKWLERIAEGIAREIEAEEAKQAAEGGGGETDSDTQSDAAES